MDSLEEDHTRYYEIIDMERFYIDNKIILVLHDPLSLSQSFTYRTCTKLY